MEHLEKISNVRVLVVGDVMLDRYWWGSVNRISPEAPVPVVNLEKISSTVGGAANVAANIKGLGSEPFLVSVVGDDAEAELLMENLTTRNISTNFLVKSAERRTTVKTRIIAHNQQIARVDQEIKEDLTEKEVKKIWAILAEVLENFDIAIVSDYGKGTMTDELLLRLITYCRDLDKVLLIDPKGKRYSKYSGATMLTPNRLEVAEACGLENHQQNLIENSGNKLLSELSLKYLLVTQGEDGMTLFEKNREAVHIPAESRNVYDVTGAGDTVIACLAASMGAGVNFVDAAKLANRAAGLVIEQVGTTAISMELLDQPHR